MKNRFMVVAFIVFVLFLNACNKKTDKIEISSNNTFYGSWIEYGYADTLKILTKSASLKENCYGFTIGQDGKFTERKNAGWCGTPPIAYENYDGNWTKLGESTLLVSVGYWGGDTSYQLKIVSVSSDTLKVRYLAVD
jgi:hypothetical protein